MQSQNGPNIKQRWALGLSSVVAVTLGLMQPTQAVEFPDAGDRGAPSRTAGGGTRGEWCEGGEWSEWSARALVPSNNVSTFSSEQASLWLHVSESFNNKTAEIYVKDTVSHEAVYEQQIELDNLYDDSIVQVDLPELNDAGMPLLKTERDYYWEFSIICDPGNRVQDYVVQGLLQRVEADAGLMATIRESSPVQQLEEYASAGLWQETLQTAALLKENQPHLWIELLSSVGLSRLAAETAVSESPNVDEVDSTDVNLTDMNLTSVGSMAVDR
ncbi:MAG: DUF928 domain-containing protein [Cyanobacteria bacterium P01_D01_bin.105]